MNIKIRDELLLIDIVVIILILIIALAPPNALRVILGIPFLLFFPGYTLMVALAPRKEQLKALERILISFGVSLVIVAATGFLLNYSHWGITLESVLYSLASFTFIASIAAWIRRRMQPESERFSIGLQLSLSGWIGSRVRDKVLTLILAAVIVAALGMFAYAIAMPKSGERFSEFYILGTEGKAAQYPKELAVMEPGSVTLGISNWEQEEVSYRIEVRIEGNKNKEIKPIVLGHGESYEKEISFVPDRSGTHQEVKFLLFRAGDTEPYRELHLWINVIE